MAGSAPAGLTGRRVEEAHVRIGSRLCENDVQQRQPALPVPFEARVRSVVAARCQATTEQFAASTSNRVFTQPGSNPAVAKRGLRTSAERRRDGPTSRFSVRLGAVSPSRPARPQGAARSAGQGGPQATAQRRAASLTGASTAPRSASPGPPPFAVVAQPPAGSWFFPRSAGAAATWRREARRPHVPNAVARGAAGRNAGLPCLVPVGTGVRPYAGRISWSSGRRTNVVARRGVMWRPPPARRTRAARASGNLRRSSRRSASPPRACGRRRLWPGAGRSAGPAPSPTPSARKTSGAG